MREIKYRGRSRPRYLHISRLSSPKQLDGQERRGRWCVAATFFVSNCTLTPGAGYHPGDVVLYKLLIEGPRSGITPSFEDVILYYRLCLVIMLEEAASMQHIWKGDTEKESARKWRDYLENNREFFYNEVASKVRKVLRLFPLHRSRYSNCRPGSSGLTVSFLPINAHDGI